MSKRICLVPFFWGIFFLTAHSQHHLQRELDYIAPDNTLLKEVLDDIALENGFYFSYQSSLPILDQPVTISHYQGTVEGLLSSLFGNQYDFKEMTGYVIIRYATGKFDLEVEMEDASKNLLIKGVVLDLDSRERVPNASIYERTSLSSSMSDSQGYFELKLNQEKFPSPWLTISKTEYRDTTFVILPTVDVPMGRGIGRFRFIPGEASSEAVENSFLGRMFIGFRQRLQRLNLGGFFADNPVQMSLIPGLSSQGMFSSQMINHFSLNALGGYTAGVEGFEAAGIFNINQRSVSGFQVAGIVNLVGGDTKGFQAAGIINSVHHNVQGMQVAGIVNRVQGKSSGLQVAGIYNRTDSTAQHQIAGILNTAEKVDGIQISGISNMTKSDAGTLQLAGLANISQGKVRHQISGLLNKAGMVEGKQIGLLNIAESSAYPIGLVNLIKDGRKSITIGADESSFAHLAFRSGGRKLYGLVGLAYQVNAGPAPYALELGFGFHLLEKERYAMDLEFVSRVATDYKDISNSISSFKWLHSYALGNHLRLITGPTLNFSVLDPNPQQIIPGWELYQRTNSQGIYGIHLGALAGLQYRL